MKLTDFKVKSNAEDSFHIAHPSGKSFTVLKKGLSPKAMEMIKKMCSGGDVQKFEGGGVAQPDIAVNPEAPQMIAAPVVAEAPVETQSAPVTEQVVPNEQPAVAEAPVADAAVSDPLVQASQQTANSLDKEEQNINRYTGQIDQATKEQRSAQQELIDKQAALQTPQAIADSYKQKDAELMKHVMDSKIDPNRYMHNMSTGSKILSAIGLVLSGAGAGARGTNLAYDHLQRAINDDIDSQKADQSKAMNLWRMNRENLHDDQATNLATQNQMLTLAQSKIAMAGATTQNAEAHFRAAEMVNKIEQQKAENRFKLGLIGQNGGGGQFNSNDPATLVPVLMAHAPPEAQKKALDEIESAENAVNNRQKILEAFDNSSKEQTVLKTGAGLLRTSPNVGALHQLMLPSFKDIDSTVRQAAMDETFHNLTPQSGDSEYKIQTKKQALINWLDSKKAAPTAKAYGIDLSHFRSTSTNPVAQLGPREQQYYSWAKAHPNSDVSQAFFKKYGIPQ